MRTRRNLSTVFALVTLVGVAALAGLWASTRSAQAISSFSLSSGMAGLAPGQTARIGVVNTGSEDVQVTLSILDDGGKVQILCYNVPSPNEAAFCDLQHPGGVNRLELRGVVVVREAAARKEAKDVIPTFQIYDSKTGRTWLILPAVHEFRGGV